MKYHPAWERLYFAVESLASNQKDIINRLENVYSSHLLALNENEFNSENAKQLFRNIMKPAVDGRLKQ
ncbi:hypothetical protein [Paenibacillus luteus]|uniref:hypothetical protein n=1 Tax=Paenibacillus luteus TaxID=2545753 RepID=UPI0011417FCA|nr:hypothetical protein [Paenibacillus luteus]